MKNNKAFFKHTTQVLVEIIFLNINSSEISDSELILQMKEIFHLNALPSLKLVDMLDTDFLI